LGPHPHEKEREKERARETEREMERGGTKRSWPYGRQYGRGIGGFLRMNKQTLGPTWYKIFL
jgi:hypothetical protein